MPRFGESDGPNPETANVWDGEAWVKARVYMPNVRTGGRIALVWDGRASGRCDECSQAVAPGHSAYRVPLRPWRSKKDPVVHVACFNRGSVERRSPSISVVYSDEVISLQQATVDFVRGLPQNRAAWARLVASGKVSPDEEATTLTAEDYRSRVDALTLPAERVATAITNMFERGLIITEEYKAASQALGFRPRLTGRERAN
jgi:hypothetical protein